MGGRSIAMPGVTDDIGHILVSTVSMASLPTLPTRWSHLAGSPLYHNQLNLLVEMQWFGAGQVSPTAIQ